MLTKKPARKRPCGIYVYCDPGERSRIKRIAKTTRRSLSAYSMMAIMQQVERDEKRLKLAP